MKDSDPRKTNYGNTLQYYNMIDTPNLLEKATGLTEQSWKGDSANKYGPAVSQRVKVAANAIKGQKKHGSDDQTIFDSLKYQGYTDDEIWKAFELAG